MATCLECGGNVKWHNPFYVCESCGVSYRKHEFESAREKRNSELWDQKYAEEEDTKQKRRDDYRKWYDKGMK